jgi:hypothetical protein
MRVPSMRQAATAGALMLMAAGVSPAVLAQSEAPLSQSPAPSNVPRAMDAPAGRLMFSRFDEATHSFLRFDSLCVQMGQERRVRRAVAVAPWRAPRRARARSAGPLYA